MEKLNEGLKIGDLKNLILPVISIDEYEAKSGDNNEVVVIAFFVNDRDPANDLSRFIEKGTVDILDTEVSGAPNPEGFYILFVELLRDKDLIKNILEMTKSLDDLTGITKWEFKPYKLDKHYPLDEKNLKKHVKIESEIDELDEKAILKFFKETLLDECVLKEENVYLKTKQFQDSYEIVDFDKVTNLYESYNLSSKPILMNPESLLESRKLTRMLGSHWSADVYEDEVLVYNSHSEYGIILKR